MNGTAKAQDEVVTVPPPLLRQGTFVTKRVGISKRSVKGVFATYVVSMLITGTLLFLVLISEDTGVQPLSFEILGLNDWTFQMANAFLLISYLSPNILFLRFSLAMAGVWFIIWAYRFKPLPLGDTLMWNVVMTIINIKQACVLLYAKLPIEFEPDIEELYMTVFAKLLSRSQFHQLVHIASKRTYLEGRIYVEQGHRVRSLAIVLRGQFHVKNHSAKHPQGVCCHSDLIPVNKHCFLDSPEFFVVDSDPNFTYEVTFEASIPTVTLEWPMSDLKRLTLHNQDLHYALLGILGMDASKRVFAHNKRF